MEKDWRRAAKLPGINDNDVSIISLHRVEAIEVSLYLRCLLACISFPAIIELLELLANLVLGFL